MICFIFTKHRASGQFRDPTKKSQENNLTPASRISQKYEPLKTVLVHNFLEQHCFRRKHPKATFNFILSHLMVDLYDILNYFQICVIKWRFCGHMSGNQLF